MTRGTQKLGLSLRRTKLKTEKKFQGTNDDDEDEDRTEKTQELKMGRKMQGWRKNLKPPIKNSGRFPQILENHSISQGQV